MATTHSLYLVTWTLWLCCNAVGYATVNCHEIHSGGLTYLAEKSMVVRLWLKTIGKGFYRMWVKSSFEQFITMQTRVGSTNRWIISQMLKFWSFIFRQSLQCSVITCHWVAVWSPVAHSVLYLKSLYLLCLVSSSYNRIFTQQGNWNGPACMEVVNMWHYANLIFFS